MTHSVGQRYLNGKVTWKAAFIRILVMLISDIFSKQKVKFLNEAVWQVSYRSDFSIGNNKGYYILFSFLEKLITYVRILDQWDRDCASIRT